MTPRLLKAESTDEETRKIEQKGLELRYQTDYTRYCDRLDNLDQNLIKAYALIYSSYCSKIMQSRVEQHADFETVIRDDPIKLLETIQVLMHDTIRGRYPYASVTDAMRNLLFIKQQENEPLLDYAKRFKQARDVLKSHIGTKILEEFVETTREYKEEGDTDEQQKLKKESFG